MLLKKSLPKKKKKIFKALITIDCKLFEEEFVKLQEWISDESVYDLWASPGLGRVQYKIAMRHVLSHFGLVHSLWLSLYHPTSLRPVSPLKTGVLTGKPSPLKGITGRRQGPASVNSNANKRKGLGVPMDEGPQGKVGLWSARSSGPPPSLLNPSDRAAEGSSPQSLCKAVVSARTEHTSKGNTMLNMAHKVSITLDVLYSWWERMLYTNTQREQRKQHVLLGSLWSSLCCAAPAVLSQEVRGRKPLPSSPWPEAPG